MASDEKTRLKALLNYWVEHNREHSQEFSEWADRARTMGETEAADEIIQAIRAMDKARKLLSQSLKRLEEV